MARKILNDMLEPARYTFQTALNGNSKSSTQTAQFQKMSKLVPGRYPRRTGCVVVLRSAGRSSAYGLYNVLPWALVPHLAFKFELIDCSPVKLETAMFVRIGPVAFFSGSFLQAK